MKLAFSTKYINPDSFLELCNFTSEYGFSGFEVANAIADKKRHEDSIFHSSETAGAKRKLVNRHIEISALAFPEAINDNTDAEDLKKYVEMASNVSGSGVIVEFETIPEREKLKAIFGPAIETAEKFGVMIMIETAGPLSDTKKVLEVINVFETAALGVAWNI